MKTIFTETTNRLNAIDLITKSCLLKVYSFKIIH